MCRLPEEGSCRVTDGAECLTPPPLELLHPDGLARHVMVHGTGRATALASMAPSGEKAPADVALLAPSRKERRNRAWVTEAGRVASSIAQDGLVVVPWPSRRLRMELAALGLEPEIQLLHLPDLRKSRFILPVRGPAARYALRFVVPVGRLKRNAARALALPWFASVAPTSLVFRRPGARPLLEWLCARRPPTPCPAIVAGSWRPTGATVVYRFGEKGEPNAIAKVGRGAAKEASALRAFSAAARGASADVPALLGERALGSLPVVIETPLRGAPAPRLLHGAPGSARGLLRAVADWLAEWNSATTIRRTFEPADAERHILARARRLSSLLGDGGTYLAWLEALCGQCTGKVTPFVAAHNDLTAANLLVRERGRLGIVDWEEAANECLPLGDLAYATADVVAAVDGYRDRPAAFATCFGLPGPVADITSKLLRDAAVAQGIDGPFAELCFQACWLRHADNERREATTREVPERPFLTILRRAAATRVFGSKP
jgi:hypothetical protein